VVLKRETLPPQPRLPLAATQQPLHEYDKARKQQLTHLAVLATDQTLPRRQHKLV
jgi:hypothetical protein